MKKAVVISLICLLLTSCVLVHPEVSPEQNEKCDLKTKKLTLNVKAFNAGHSTGNEAELAILIGSAAVTFIVSGSIAVVGNTIYWVEEYGKCEQSEVDDALTDLKELIGRLGGWFASNLEEVSNWFGDQIHTNKNQELTKP